MSKKKQGLHTQLNNLENSLPYNVIIVDDEPDAIKVLSYLLENHSSILNITAKCSDAKSAIKKIRKENPDLVFLDIKMPGISGIELAVEIKNLSDESKIIFTSAYHEYLKEGYKVQPFDFLTKPICPDELKNTLDRFVAHHPKSKKANETTSHLFITTSRGKQIIPFNDIRYILYTNRKCVIYRKNSPESYISLSLNKLILRLPPEHFIRISNNVVVNIDAVDVINKYEVELKPHNAIKTTDSFVVGRKFLNKLKDLLEGSYHFGDKKNSEQNNSF